MVFLLGVIVTGSVWFFGGRYNLTEIRSNLDRSNRAFEGVQSALGELQDHSLGFTEDISHIAKESGRITDKSRDIETGLGEVDGIVRGVAGQVDKVTDENRQIIRVGRDIGDIAFRLRRLSEESRIQE